MSIRCVCPKGHVLKVRESLAGTVCTCPACKTQIKVPQIQQRLVSEDAIMDILGCHVAPQHAAPTGSTVPEPAAKSAAPEAVPPGTPKKSCYKCNLEISSGTHICPHCHTYIAKLGDF